MPEGKSAEQTPARDARRCNRCGEIVPLFYHFCGACGFNLTGLSRDVAFRDPLIGAVIGERYRLLARIGMGGMGSVYKAEHVRMGKIVAVKLLHGDLSRDELMIRRFTREARAVSKLSNPHTVSVFDYGQSDGLVYLVMEYLQGHDLGYVLRKTEKLGLDRTAKIVAQVSSSLMEAHQLGIIHRDLKPENLFVCASMNDGTAELVKVLDFGLAKVCEAREESIIDTQQGNLIGTPYYMSPEQISGENVDNRVDIYGLGAVVFRLLTGKPPYQHDNPVVVLSKHLNEPVPRVSDLVPELKAADAAVARALAKNPDERYQTIANFAADLARAAEDPNALEETRDAWPVIDVRNLSLEEISTQADFDKYEIGLKLRRFLSMFVALAILAGGGYAFWWGVIEKGFVRSEVETEPNDDIGSADPVFLGESIQGFIGPAAVGQRADVDFFVVENTPDRSIMVSAVVTGVPNLDIVVKVYSEDGGSPLIIADSGGVGEGEALPNIPLNEHYLYLQIREYWVRNRPALNNLQDPYELQVSFRDPLPNEEREPNEHGHRALQMLSGDVYTGLIGWAGDIDLYRAPNLEAGGTMVDVEVTGGGDVDIEIRAFDISAAELFRSNHAPAGEPERLTFFAAPDGHGVLFLGVAAAGESAWSAEDFYEISVTFRPVEPLQVPEFEF
jgi:serine/threonine-protein kinase